MYLITIVFLILLVLIALVWLGLRIKPSPFTPHPARTPILTSIPLPAGLPAPVERFYQKVYGETLPLIETVVITGRGTIRPVMKIPLPARFVWVHNAGRDYRHYFEATLFGLPFLKVNEGILDGHSFFESPMGSSADDPNTNQGANLALWAEAGWFPSIFITDGRVRWEPVDEHTALLYVPFNEKQEHFVVRFNPETGLIDMMEAMRFRNPGDADKILWLAINEQGDQKIEGTPLSATGSAIWLDQGQPWAVFTLEDIVYNIDVSQYIRQRGS